MSAGWLRRRTRWRRLAGAGAALGVVATLGVVTAKPAVPAAAQAAAARVPIRHVVEIMLENHSFDSLFGHFPGADGIPAGTALPNPDPHASAPVVPFEAPPNQGTVYDGINNSRSAERVAMNLVGPSYLMNRYTTFPGDGLATVTTMPPALDPNLQALAHQFVLADHNFQPEIAPTQPNVISALAATSDGWMSNADPPAADRFNTIFDELSAYHRSWKIYYGVPTSILAGSVWYRMIPPGSAAGITTTSQFVSDVAANRLPSFSLVRPGFGYSQEPPEDMQMGDAWLGQLVAAVEHSPEWSSTAIFVTYDESGGFWDHVSPPRVTQFGYGSRTPMVVISPYSPPAVLHAQTTNISVLSFMQHIWAMPALDPLNAVQSDLMPAFDFHQRPRRPPPLPDVPTATLRMAVGTLTAPAYVASPGRAVAISLGAEGAGLALDTALSGPVSLQVASPAGAQPPRGVPSQVALRAGTASFAVSFPSVGFYRITASGPDGSKGWMTVEVGVGPNTP